MAAAAIARRCGLSELDDKFVQRPDVQAFMPKVAVKTVAGRSDDDAAMGPADRVCVTLRDNKQHTSPTVSHPLGHFKNPIGDDELWGKFADCINGAPIEARPLFDRLQRIDTLASVAELGR
jgi:2-methylcitrate dehydratase PrpD